MSDKPSLFDVLGWSFTMHDVRRIMHCGADINEVDTSTSETPIFWLLQCARPDIEILKFFIDCNADLNMVNELGETPLHIAAYYNHTAEACKILVDNKCRVNQQDRKGNTPLHIAVFHNENAEIANYLISIGADLSIVNYEGVTIYQNALRGKYLNKKNMKKLGRAYNKLMKGK